ncbi:MAG: signal peptide peptidase SppA [Vampirovibrio sp.]
MMALELQNSKTFSWVLLGLITVTLILGSLSLVLKSIHPSETEATTDISQNYFPNNLKAFPKKVTGEHLALIKLEGEIQSTPDSGGFMSDHNGAIAVREALDLAAMDDRIKGVLLMINSPGGTVGMSQELNAAIKRVRANKPIVASFLDVAASGGYYAACATDRIVSNKGTLTGSIGVIMQSMNLQDLMERKLGVKSITIKSGRFKDLLNPYRKTSSAELALLQRIIDDSYRDFLATVLEGRLRTLNTADEKAKRQARITAIADGRILTGNQALNAGLVDEIGDAYYAKTVLQGLVNERFRLDSSTEMDLAPYEVDNDFLRDFLHLPLGEASQRLDLKSLVHLLNPQIQNDQHLPLTARYPNQPLWLFQ